MAMAWWSRLIPDDGVAVCYEDPTLHERVVLWPVAASKWVVGTPVGDQYEEDIGGFDPGPVEGFALDGRRRLAGGLKRHIYRFKSRPSNAALKAMISATRRRVGRRGRALRGHPRGGQGEGAGVRHEADCVRRGGPRRCVG